MTSNGIAEKQTYEHLEERIEFLFGKKSPISALMEYAQYRRIKEVPFVEVVPQYGVDHMPRFTYAAELAGRQFAAVEGGSIKKCKTGAAYLAWKKVIEEDQKKFQDILQSEADSHTKLAALVHLEYLRRVEKTPQGFAGRKVLAAIVQVEESLMHNPTFCVVSLGVGNRTILGSNLDLDGHAINDSHAEIIARRAFIRYLYKNLLRNYSSDEKPLLVQDQKTGKLIVRNGISFHMYISTAPCGDSALFSRTEEEHRYDDKPIFTDDKQGLLRTKIEAGEGCIPVEKNCMQTLVGLSFGKRLLTMSCSDKICRWSVLGVQGALLSHFINPVYLSSLTIGGNYVYGHVSRALYYRLSKSCEDPVLDLPEGYVPTMPVLGHTELEVSLQETEKSLPLVASWTGQDERMDIVDGTTGKKMDTDTDESPPQVSKASLFLEFQKTYREFHRHTCMPAWNYREAKEAAVDYQLAKEKLNDKLTSQKYGTWVKKPLGLEEFS